MYDLTDVIYTDADVARAHLERLHWPQGPACPHCGSLDGITRLSGKSTRPGVHMCNPCRKPFTVTVGTIFEDSKIPLNKWLLAFRLIAGSKKGISAHQLHRSIGITYKSAWFMAHRIREAMSGDMGVLGGVDEVVEVDETYVGGKEGNKHASKRLNRGRGAVGKHTVVSLVQRDGNVASFHTANITASGVRPFLIAKIDKASYLMTDESKLYGRIGSHFNGHGRVNHSRGEYVTRADSSTQTRLKTFSRSSSAELSARTII